MIDDRVWPCQDILQYFSFISNYFINLFLRIHLLTASANCEGHPIYSNKLQIKCIEWEREKEMQHWWLYISKCHLTNCIALNTNLNILNNQKDLWSFEERFVYVQAHCFIPSHESNEIVCETKLIGSKVNWPFLREYVERSAAGFFHYSRRNRKLLILFC